MTSEADSRKVRQKSRKHSSAETDGSDLRISSTSRRKPGTAASRSALGAALTTAFASMSVALASSALPAWMSARPRPCTPQRRSDISESTQTGRSAIAEPAAREGREQCILNNFDKKLLKNGS